MKAKRDMRRKMTNKYCTTSYRLESYLLRMEERREKDEANNKRAYREAREMSAWLSVWKHGNAEYRKMAAKAINLW